VTLMIFTGPGFDFAIWCFQRLSPEQNFQATGPMAIRTPAISPYRPEKQLLHEKEGER
jgi:hypothetical protein